MTALGLLAVLRLSLVAVGGGYSLVVVLELLVVMASLVDKQKLKGTWASVVSV